MTPSYEAFLSSRENCKLREHTPCRRSVLPGRKFGCQRPLGWCMNGEHYHRDVDCDGDGHFDHVCETPSHNGFISSSMDCIDTWEEGTQGRKCEPKSPILGAMGILSAQDASYKLVVDSGSCTQHVTPSCVQSHADWPNTEYPATGCRLHVEWSRPTATSEPEGCINNRNSNETLYLDVLHMDIEPAHFVTEGYLYGERFKIGGVTANANTATRERYPVQDKTMIDWSTDATVQRRGWLACLRLRTKPPKVYNASCTEIGDDIWADLDIKAGQALVVQCDQKKCGKDKVRPASTTSEHSFLRTTNICDAGWQTTKSSKFTISFQTALHARDGESEDYSTFEVGF